MATKFQRRSSALKNVAMKRSSINAVVNLNALVRVFFLDGSSKVLQMFETSTCRDVLIQLKFNLDLQDISTHALFRVLGHNVRRVDLDEKITDALRDPTNSGQEVRLLFRSWITYKYGVYDSEVFQYGNRHKQANTALWLTFMEATFMTMTGKFYLTEDESLMLGCLKMQAEAGDFRPEVHNIDIIKTRVANRFPNPVRSKMKALCSSTVGGSRAADDLANRVLAMYARVAGKSKVEAQIDYLDCLRMWCPFYGSTFYDVQCQYDDNPLDASSTPPVIAMNASIGPLAIFLVTPTDPPVIMRHSYKRIIKWVTHADKHIFTYWVIKPHISVSDMEEYQEEHRDDGEIDTRQFCDCVYLVTSQVREMEYLVKSYIEAVTDIPPALPGATDELLPPKRVFDQILAQEQQQNNSSTQPAPEQDDDEAANQEEDRPAAPKEEERKPVKSRLSVFFNALGGFDSSSPNVSSGSGLANHESSGGDEIYGDDTAGVGNSFFKGMYQSAKKRGSLVLEGNPEADEDASVNKIPPNVKYAASMSELKRLAEEAEFSDEDDEDDGEEEDDDDEDGSDEEEKTSKTKHKGKGKKSKDDEEEDIPAQQLGGGVPSMTAFRRASRILFGAFQQPGTNQPKSPNVNDKENSDGDDDSSSGAGSDNDDSSGDGNANQDNSSDDD